METEVAYYHDTYAPEPPPLPDAWFSEYQDDLFDLYDDVLDTLSTRFVFSMGCMFSRFADFCHRMYRLDRKLPHVARMRAPNPDLALPKIPADKTLPCYPAHDGIFRKLPFGWWCRAHADILNGTYDVLAEDLLDPDRQSTQGYMDDWACFVYRHAL